MTRQRSEEVIALAHEQGVAHALADGTILRGWALATQGQGKEGIEQIRQGIAVFRAMRAEGTLTYYLALLAEAYEKAVLSEEGLRVLDKALDLMRKTEERFYEAELWRLKGQLTLQLRTRDGC